MNQESGIKSFTDLFAWQKGHELVLAIYTLVKQFPDDEKYALSSQIRRAAVSITSNIAEGFSRQSYADKKHFYVMAHGSLTEVQNQLLIARDTSMIAEVDFSPIAKLAVEVHKLLSGLIKKTEELRHDS
jgi:four helix bundle protein